MIFKSQTLLPSYFFLLQAKNFLLNFRHQLLTQDFETNSRKKKTPLESISLFAPKKAS
jgi:hypothetical protein